MLVNVTLWGASPSDEEKVKLATGPGITPPEPSPEFSPVVSSPTSSTDCVALPPEHEAINKQISIK